MFLFLRVTTSMLLGLVFLGMHRRSKPVPMLLQDVATCISALVGSSAAPIFQCYRERTSNLLRTINEINMDILKREHNALENRRSSNRLFLAMKIMCTVIEVSGSMAFIMFAWEFVKSGLPQFNRFLYQPEPYSVIAYVDEILFLCSGFWMMSLCTFCTSMYMEFILRISFYLRVTGEEMRQLRKGVDFDEEKEQLKLKSLIKDLNLLHW